MTTASSNACLITGSRGFLGGCIRRKFAAEGWQPIELVRRPTDEDIRAGRAVKFQLGDDIAVNSLKGATALVHCAHDFSLRTWSDIHSVNVLGALRLFEAARAAGIPRLVFISSMSAYDGCRSHYGGAKLETEKRLRDFGAFLVRPGLIYDENPGGIFANLVKQTRNSRMLPLFGGGGQVLYLTHQADLCSAIYAHASGQIPGGPAPVTAANESGWTFRSILEALARAQGNEPRFIRIPWRLVWLVIKTAELCRIPLKFRSDSLVSLMHQNLHPSFELTRKLGLKFRPFAAGSLKY